MCSPPRSAISPSTKGWSPRTSRPLAKATARCATAACTSTRPTTTRPCCGCGTPARSATGTRTENRDDQRARAADRSTGAGTRHHVRRADRRPHAARLRRRRDQGRGPGHRRLRPALATAEGRPVARLRPAQRGQAVHRHRPAPRRRTRARPAAGRPGRRGGRVVPAGPPGGLGPGLRPPVPRQPRPDPDPSLRLRADRPVPRAARLRHRGRDGQRLRLTQRLARVPAPMGTAMALYRRERTGAGDVIDVALSEPLMFIVGDLILKYGALGEIQDRVGNGTGSASPRGIYQAADGGWLSIAASNQTIARRLFAAMGQPELIEDPRFATNPARLANNEAIQAEVSQWVASRSRQEILEILEKFEVVSAGVNDAADIVADPHFRERTLTELTGNQILGGVLMPGPVLHLRGYDGPGYHGVPQIGEHTRSVLADWLGLADAEFDGLAAARVVLQAP